MRCLASITGQTRKPDCILIVDNASTDGTLDLLQSEGWLSRHDVELIALCENTGGAGGFATGLKHATEAGAKWVWMMDDDAEPHLDALEKLLNRKLDPANLYTSVAVKDHELAWPLIGEGALQEETILHKDQLPKELEVRYTPFLGILVSSAMVSHIGLPDAGFFIASDDTDYCYRAKAAGAKIIMAGDSLIEHPASVRYRLWLPNRLFYTLRLVPWKRYYDVRNRLLVTRNHFGMAVYYSAIPGALLRLVATLWHEPNRLQQIRATFAGIIDGVLNRKGRRHELWGIRS